MLITYLCKILIIKLKLTLIHAILRDILSIKQYINYESKLFNFEISIDNKFASKILIVSKKYTFSNIFKPKC